MDDLNAKRSESQEPSSPLWMVTYGDMVTLLLTFFVLLISFAEMDEIKFEEAAHSLRGALGVLEGYESFFKHKPEDADSAKIDVLRRMDIFQSIVELEDMAREMGYAGDVSVEISDNGLLIRMGDRVLFDQGRAELKPEALPVLDLVGRTIKGRAREVLVAGHTDDVPIHTDEFPSNWELSTTRALNVVKYLIDRAGVPPGILAATGYSEFRPLVPNDSPQHRRKNRRVEFLVTWH